MHWKNDKSIYLSVRLSVHPSVKCVDCDRTEKRFLYHMQDNIA